MANSRPFFREALDYNASCSSMQHTEGIWDDNTPDPCSLFEKSDQSLDLEEVVINSNTTDGPQNQALRTFRRLAKSVQDDKCGEDNLGLSQATGSESVSSLGESLNSSARFFLLPVLPSNDKARMLLVKRSLMLSSSRIAAQNAAYGAHCIAASTTAGGAKTTMWMMLSLLVGTTLLSTGIAAGFISYFSGGVASLFSEAPSPNTIKRAIGQVPFDQVGLALLVEGNGSSIEHDVINEFNHDSIHADQDMPSSSNFVEGSNHLEPELLASVNSDPVLQQPTRSPERNPSQPVPPKAFTLTQPHPTFPSAHPTLHLSSSSTEATTPDLEQTPSYRHYTVSTSTSDSSLNSLPVPSAPAAVNTKQDAPFLVQPSQTPADTRDPLVPPSPSLNPYSGLSSTMMPELDMPSYLARDALDSAAVQPTSPTPPPQRTSVSPVLSLGEVGHDVSPTSFASSAPHLKLSNFPVSIPSEAPSASPLGDSSMFPTNISTWSTYRPMAPTFGVSERPHTLSILRESDNPQVLDDRFPSSLSPSARPSLFGMSPPPLKPSPVNIEERPVMPTMTPTTIKESPLVGSATQSKSPVSESISYSPPLLYTTSPTSVPSLQPLPPSQAKKDANMLYFTTDPTYQTLWPSKSPSALQRSSSFDPSSIPSSGPTTVSAQPSNVPRSVSSVDPVAFSAPTDQAVFSSLTPSLVQSATESTPPASQSVFPAQKLSSGPPTGNFVPSESHLSIGPPPTASTIPSSTQVPSSGPSNGQSGVVTSNPSSISPDNSIYFPATQPSSLPSLGVSRGSFELPSPDPSSISIDGIESATPSMSSSSPSGYSAHFNSTRSTIPTCGPSESTSVRLSAMPNSGLSISISAASKMMSTQPSSKPSSGPSIILRRMSSLPSTQPSSMPSHGPSKGQIPSSVTQPSALPSSGLSTGSLEFPSPNPSSISIGGVESTTAPTQPGFIPSSGPSGSPTYFDSTRDSIPTCGPSGSTSAQLSSIPSSGSHVPTRAAPNMSSTQPGETPTSLITSLSTLPSIQLNSMANLGPSKGQTAGQSALSISQPSPMLTNSQAAVLSTQTDYLTSCSPASPGQSAPFTGSNSVGPVATASPQPTLSFGLDTTIPSWNVTSSSNGGLSKNPSAPPRYMASRRPSSSQSPVPTWNPISSGPSGLSTTGPSLGRYRFHTWSPSSGPSTMPLKMPSGIPSSGPIVGPTVIPTPNPISVPNNAQLVQSSSMPSCGLSVVASLLPSSNPSSVTTNGQLTMPSLQPSFVPKHSPSSDQSTFPTGGPSTTWPTTQPIVVPSYAPSLGQYGVPSWNPISSLSRGPSAKPSMQLSMVISSDLSAHQPATTSNAGSIPPSGPSDMESTPSSSAQSTHTVSFEMEAANVESQPPSLLVVTTRSREPTEQPSKSAKVVEDFEPSGNPTVAPVSAVPGEPSSNPTQRPNESTVRPSGVPSGRANLDDPSRGVSSFPWGKLTEPPNNEQSGELQSDDCSILGFALWDADRNKQVRPLLDGSVVCPTPLRFNIEAVVHPGDCEEPVTIDYSGPRLNSSRVEWVFPYLAFGDIPEVDVKGRWMREGEITVSATLLNGDSQSSTIHFRVGTAGCL